MKTTLIQWMKERPHIWAALFLLVYLAGFILIEHVSFSDYYVCHIPLDDYIPFCEWFIFPYVLWYPYLAALGFFLIAQKDGEEFYRYMAFVFGSMTLCILIYFIFPNCQDMRPQVLPRDNIATRLLASIYSADTSTNVLPSMHVLASMEIHAMVLKSRYALLRKRSVRIVSFLCALLISLSTVFVKQHSILDAFAAIALFIPLYFFFYGFDPIRRLISRHERKKRKTEP
ncbi:MAG: phosphoesterase [Clostridia bacterium]|nr:phosphoesterase [Clostridia bacterium]